MKKVAILTFDALANSRSFFWDNVQEKFKAKLTESVTQEADGLCVIGGETTAQFNNPYRVRFANGEAILGDLKLSVKSTGDGPVIELSTVGYAGMITEMNIRGNDEENADNYNEIDTGRVLTLTYSESFRISYLKDDRVVVMDVFWAFDYNTDQYPTPVDGFVDVIIDGIGHDFNNLPNEYVPM